LFHHCQKSGAVKASAANAIVREMDNVCKALSCGELLQHSFLIGNGIALTLLVIIFRSFFSLRWARYLQTAALNRRPVSFVPLTTCVKVLFSTTSCICHRLLSTDFAGVAFDTKSGPPASAAGISAWQ